MSRKKTPVRAGKLRRAGTPAVGGARPDNETVWNACREALDAAASREAQAVAHLQSAALKFGGFTLNEKGNRWVTHCPHCGGKVELYSDNSGVGVVGYGNDSKCRAVPRIEQWLRESGFRS
jgi:hypothetical protein